MPLTRHGQAQIQRQNHLLFFGSAMKYIPRINFINVTQSKLMSTSTILFTQSHWCWFHFAMYIGECPVTFIFLVNIYKLFTYWKENKILKGKTLPPKENSSNPLPWKLIKPSVYFLSHDLFNKSCDLYKLYMWMVLWVAT